MCTYSAGRAGPDFVLHEERDRLLAFPIRNLNQTPVLMIAACTQGLRQNLEHLEKTSAEGVRRAEEEQKKVGMKLSDLPKDPNGPCAGGCLPETTTRMGSNAFYKLCVYLSKL